MIIILYTELDYLSIILILIISFSFFMAHFVHFQFHFFSISLLIYLPQQFNDERSDAQSSSTFASSHLQDLRNLQQQCSYCIFFGWVICVLVLIHVSFLFLFLFLVLFLFLFLVLSFSFFTCNDCIAKNFWNCEFGAFSSKLKVNQQFIVTSLSQDLIKNFYHTTKLKLMKINE